MKGFGSLRNEYVSQSRRRIQELDTEIQGIENRISRIEQAETCAECTGLLDELKSEARSLATSVNDLISLRSESWDWALEIEDTEMLFNALRRHVREARKVLDNNEKRRR